MRTLEFNVKGQIIEKDSSCDFGGLVAGTSGYLKAKFNFSSSWDGCTKVVGFYTKNGEELEPCALSPENTCEIPASALKRHEFHIRVYGARHGRLITTRPVIIRQYGGI